MLHPGSPLYSDASERGYLLSAGYADETPAVRPTENYREGQRYLDFSNRDAAAWWWEQHRPLAALGIEGWWLDGGEGPGAEVRLRAGAGAALHNRYDVMRQRAFADGEAADRPDLRVFLLCRSGGAGMQRFGAACWSGDIDATVPSLEPQPAVGLSMGLSSASRRRARAPSASGRRPATQPRRRRGASIRCRCAHPRGRAASGWTPETCRGGRTAADGGTRTDACRCPCRRRRPRSRSSGDRIPRRGSRHGGSRRETIARRDRRRGTFAVMPQNSPLPK